ncbi:murein hydrolase activator EnvC family protein [Henriciella marina]|uniref:murein hydrolase activator EnvC family protein n=1 Tax=Henriciella marina TaxID=453851 RepID=UPI000382D129|nr:peptidoglycan DD-metalloendopeptidase family protein [Henriciella marina]
MRHRLLRLLIIPLAGCLMAAAPREFTREELSALESQRQSAIRQLEALENAESASSRDVTDLERQLISAALESRRREEQAAASELKLIDLETRLTAAREALIEGNENLEDIMANLAVSGRHRPPALIASPNEANAAIRAAIVMSATAPRINQRTDELAAEITELKALEESVLEEQERLAAAEDRLAAKQAEIETLVASKRAQYESVSGEAEALRARVRQIAGEAETLRDLLAALETQAPRAPAIKPRAQIQLAATRTSPTVSDAPRNPARSPAVANLRPLGREALGGLIQPVSGLVSRTWGDDLPGGETAKGLYIQPRSNADIVAPVDGTIEYAEAFRSYGQLLIISTSDGYHILLSGMGRIYGTPGQTVRAGEPVGRMSERENPPPELYLEVRRKGVPMNPARWMQGG